MRAIGAESAVIEVQSGWRDRQDLIGHFNAFERRFYESEFLKAMYRALTPFYRDTPFIIVLIEMNLSHPEQYFADLLSALERTRIFNASLLMTAAVVLEFPCLHQQLFIVAPIFLLYQYLQLVHQQLLLYQ